ncbi:MAG: ATP-dependent DNA helicase [Propionibacteriaceae bacterium]|jgi:ATP-dependent DNA helicase DinG|nr:ATP-dependent DNA helicase [Propionibacteriaceae bacterium]
MSILDAAVAAIGGERREGQEQMAREVAKTFDGFGHLLVQAGTGTGKSLGYLAPALAHLAAAPQSRVIVATATLALQRQLATKDIPTAVAAAQEVTGKTIRHAVLKGRSNYACLHKVRYAPEAQNALFAAADLPASELGSEVVMLREWAELDETGDRDDAPPHTPAAWAQVSVSARECLMAECPYLGECRVELARDTARNSQLVVTNHALLAVNAMNDGNALPEHDVLIIDEAHELVARVTSAASAELSPQQVERVAKAALDKLSDETGADLLDAADLLQEALDEADLARVEDPEAQLVFTLARIRDLARTGLSEIGPAPESKQLAAGMQEVFETAESMAALNPNSVVWVSERERFGRQVCLAPLDVAELMRAQVFDETSAVLTSATLKIGGDFTALAQSVGMDDYRAIDVGSPFDYGKQGILYIAKDLPAPGRDGITAPVLERVSELIWAAGGRTLGLFASQRNAEAAARWCRQELDMDILCQGDAQLPELTRRFIADESACLFGTLSLWQGVDVPGETCQLVIIDKIPFPRPDDPLMQARQQAVSDRGGNGFMAVAATQAGLLLAQGSGRLIRTASDRGVVAVLDPRLMTARYGSFLRASMPGFWTTADTETVIAALQRLDHSAPK